MNKISNAGVLALIATLGGSVLVMADATINTPPTLVACMPNQISFDGVNGSAVIRVMKGADVGATDALETLTVAEGQKSVTYEPKEAPGTQVTFVLTDQSGKPAYSGQVPIAAGGGQCGDDSTTPSTSSTTSSSTSGTANSSASGTGSGAASAPGSSAPGSSAPGATTPASSAPGASAPASSAPGASAPPASAPAGSSPASPASTAPKANPGAANPAGSSSNGTGSKNLTSTGLLGTSASSAFGPAPLAAPATVAALVATIGFLAGFANW